MSNTIDGTEIWDVGDRHVTPAINSDEPVHSLDGTCWCQPVVDYTEPLTGARVFVHRRTLDSPHYEVES